MTGRLSGDGGQPASCRDCGWTGTAMALDRHDVDAAGGDPVAHACPRCGALVLPDLPSADEIRDARHAPEA